MLVVICALGAPLATLSCLLGSGVWEPEPGTDSLLDTLRHLPGQGEGLCCVSSFRGGAGGLASPS